MRSTQELRQKAAQIRGDMLTIIYSGKAGHTGGDLSCADIMTALYYKVLKVRPNEPCWPGRDYFVLSKGHCVETYYAVLADLGFFSKEELSTYMRFGTRFIGHPTNKVPGIEMNTGALGHGLSVGVGMALGLARDEKQNRVFVLMGDGELEEGSVWEAAMAAPRYSLSRLTAIIDRNRLQISGSTEEVSNLEPLAARWRAFGWRVVEMDGHDMEALVKTFSASPDETGRPTLVIANTVKGKGVAEMENVAKWHHGVPDDATYKSAIAQLQRQAEEARDT